MKERKLHVEICVNLQQLAFNASNIIHGLQQDSSNSESKRLCGPKG